MRINDLWQRAGKTFVQAFGGALVVQIIPVLKDIWSYDWTNWKAWVIPIITGALAAGISAGWNAIINVSDKNKITV